MFVCMDAEDGEWEIVEGEKSMKRIDWWTLVLALLGIVGLVLYNWYGSLIYLK